MSAAKARTLLGKLLDRIEERSERKNAVRETPPSFESAAERDAFDTVIMGAERAGAVSIVRPRDFNRRHLIEKVTLEDPVRLYAFVGRKPLGDRIAEAVTHVRGALPALHGDAEACFAYLQAGWAVNRRPLSLPPEGVEAVRFLRALDAVLARPQDDRRDLRTFSAQALGDSKALEEQRSRIVNWFVELGRIPRDLDEEGAYAAAGLEKFQHPVLVAGPVRVNGAPLGDVTYIGLAPDDIDRVEPAAAAGVVLTIENFASFNRHVREARSASEIVIYTGGFPSRGVLMLLRRVVVKKRVQAWHWGDVDGGGLRIAEYLAQNLPSTAAGLRLHLMAPELVRRVGRPAAPIPALSSLSGSADIEVVARFLASEGASHLEQEIVDPSPVAPSGPSP
jgi:hypothetical protein